MNTAPASSIAGDEGFGLYVHWPFCLSKCPYCDFNSHVATDVDQAAWRDALLRELAHFADRAPGRYLTSILFGGGTPSLMEPDTVAQIIAAARALWSTRGRLEVTLEANPGTVDGARFSALRAAGINRLSMGVQALNDSDLRFLGRKHSIMEARAAWRSAASIFSRVSFDLIYARPEQTVTGWTQELREALAEVRNCGITHLSLYQLTMEPGTAMYAAYGRGDFTLPDEDTAATLYEVTQELCAEHGLPAYEISNHAGGEAACRHNLTYWRGGDYVGIGPGAHGRLTLDGITHATSQMRAPALWLKQVKDQGHATQTDTPISARERTEELVMMGLRTTEGLDKARFARLAGASLADAVSPSARTRLVNDGYLKEDAARLVATPRGFLALNTIIGDLLT